MTTTKIVYVQGEDSSRELAPGENITIAPGDSINFAVRTEHISCLLREGEQLKIGILTTQPVVIDNFFTATTARPPLLIFDDMMLTPADVEKQLLFDFEIIDNKNKTHYYNAAGGSLVGVMAGEQILISHPDVSVENLHRVGSNIRINYLETESSPGDYLLLGDFFSPIAPGKQSPLLKLTNRNFGSTEEILIHPHDKQFAWKQKPRAVANVGTLYAYYFSLNKEIDKIRNIDVTADGSSLPAWLSLTEMGGGQYMLAGVPNKSDIGTNDIKITISHVDEKTGIYTQKSFPLTIKSRNGVTQRAIAAAAAGVMTRARSDGDASDYIEAAERSAEQSMVSLPVLAALSGLGLLTKTAFADTFSEPYIDEYLPDMNVIIDEGILEELRVNGESIASIDHGLLYNLPEDFLDQEYLMQIEFNSTALSDPSNTLEGDTINALVSTRSINTGEAAAQRDFIFPQAESNAEFEQFIIPDEISTEDTSADPPVDPPADPPVDPPADPPTDPPTDPHEDPPADPPSITPEISIPPGSTSAPEAGGEAEILNFTLHLSEASDSDVLVHFSTIDGSAKAGEDFVGAINLPLIIPAGVTSADITIEIIGDDIYEGMENFFIHIESAELTPSGIALTVTNDTSEIILIDSDQIPTVQISDGEPDFQMEADGNIITFTVTVSGKTAEDIVIHYNTLNGEAEMGEDFLDLMNGELIISAGSTTGTIEIQILNDDMHEASETFKIELIDAELADGTVLNITDSIGIGEIHDDDPIPKEALFSNENDVVDFNNLLAGSYEVGTQYDALNGNDTVILPFDAIAAIQSGYEVGTPFNTGDGNNVIIGGDLDDTIIVGDGYNQIYGGGGNNTLDYSETSASSVKVNLNAGVGIKFLDESAVVDHFSDFDNAIGTDGDDFLMGNANNNELYGEGGEDRLFGRHGDDVLHFDQFDELVSGDHGYDTASLTDVGVYLELDDLDLSSIEKLFFEGLGNIIEISPDDVKHATDSDNVLDIDGIAEGDNQIQLNEIDGWTTTEPGVYEATVDHHQVTLNVNEVNVDVVLNTVG